MNKLTETAPERICLQISDEESDRDVAFQKIEALAEITWCAESVMEVEVAYVRADIAQCPAGFRLQPICEFDANNRVVQMMRDEPEAAQARIAELEEQISEDYQLDA